MSHELTGKKRILHALVVDQIANRLHHIRITENRMGCIRRHVDHGSLGIAVDGDVGITLDALHLVRCQVASHVDVAFLQQQSLSGRLAHVTHDDAFDRGGAVPVVGEGIHGH